MSDDLSFPREQDATADAATAPAALQYALQDAVRAAYVDAALALQYPALPADATARVHEQFARIASLAAQVLAFPLAADDEPAPVFRL